MKLSRRGKSARRGRHTKRAVKHYTRRIKHRCKQYKKTYRKNNRKLKHNKRIQSGGVAITVKWSGNEDTRTASNVQLTYKKKDEWMEDDKPFDITLIYNGAGEYGRSNFTITMTRKTKVVKTFVLYFKLGEYKLYFSQRGNEFGCDDATIFLEPGNRDIYMYCSGASLTFTTSDVNNTETYVFPCNSMNLEFFRSLESQMRRIINTKNNLEKTNAKNASDKNIQERERQIEDGTLNIYFTTGSVPVNYVTFTTELREKVDSIKGEITQNKLYDENKKRSLIMNLENIESRIIEAQLKSMKTALKDIQLANQQQNEVQGLLSSLESFRPANTYDQGQASMQHYDSQKTPPPIEYVTRTDGTLVLDERGNPIPVTPPSGPDSFNYN